jgi:HEAT repeat protein
VGLQDSITVDLFYVDGLDVVALPQYIAVARRSTEELSMFSKDMAIWLGSITGTDQVWHGSLKKQGNEIALELRGVDVWTQREIFGMSISTTTDKLLSAESALVIEVLDTIGFKLTDSQRARILSPKTKSVRAFELNAKGYEVQQRISLVRDRSGFYREWVRLLSGAVAEDPGYAEAWVNLGWALYTSDDKNGALKAFSNALELKPYLIDATVGVGYVMRDYKNDSAKALEYMAKAVELNPGLEWTNKELIKTIAKAEGKAAIPYILDLLDNERKSILIAAIEALGRFRDVSLLPEIGKFISDSDEDIQYTAVNAIIIIGTEAAIPYLEDALKGSYGKREIVRVILSISEEAGIPHLIAMLKDTSTDDCIFAAEELGRGMVVQAVPDLIEAMGEYKELSLAAMRAIADIGDDAAMPAIINALKDERKGIRVVAAAMLGDYEATDAMPALWEMAKTDKEPKLRLRALISIALMGDGEAISLLAEVVRGDDQEKARYVTKRVLQRPAKFMGTDLEFLFVNDNET